VVGAAALFVVMGVGFTAKVIAEGRKATRAMKRLSTSAPVFAARAEELLRNGDFEGALEAADNAVDLDASVAEHHVVRGNALQVLMRLEGAKRAYGRALEMGKNERASVGLKLTEEVMTKVALEGEAKGKVALYEGLKGQGRHRDALAFASDLDYSREKRRDLDAIDTLIAAIEEKLLSVPDTGILLSKTEVTVGEWKLYLKSEGLNDWVQPAADRFIQTDSHPVVGITWEAASDFCRKLTEASGKLWRLPKPAEWLAACGGYPYPYGDNFPPSAEDGNYAVLPDGSEDSSLVGVDGRLGTSPVGSFKPNPLGFYDLGGNVWEWMLEGWRVAGRPEIGYARGGGWNAGKGLESSRILYPHPNDRTLRLALGFPSVSDEVSKSKTLGAPEAAIRLKGDKPSSCGLGVCALNSNGLLYSRELARSHR
jgi:hypothetical protein